MIRAKFVVNTVNRIHSNGNDLQEHTEQVTLSAVYSDKEGSVNKQWSKWTPSGSITMSISNPAAQGKFQPGMFTYVDFHECDKDSP